MKEFWPQNIEPDSNVRKKLELERIVTISFTTKTTNIASSSVCERKWQFCYFYRGFSTSVKTFLHEISRIIRYSPTILPFLVSCHHNLKTQRFLNVAYCPTCMCTTLVQNRDWRMLLVKKGIDIQILWLWQLTVEKVHPKEIQEGRANVVVSKDWAKIFVWLLFHWF